MPQRRGLDLDVCTHIQGDDNGYRSAGSAIKSVCLVLLWCDQNLVPNRPNFKMLTHLGHVVGGVMPSCLRSFWIVSSHKI